MVSRSQSQSKRSPSRTSTLSSPMGSASEERSNTRRHCRVTGTDKREFLADIVSFANAAGGDILYGIDAKNGIPTSAFGTNAFDADATTLRLENMIRDGGSPRITGVQIRIVEGFRDGPILMLRIPKSWAAPHMVTFNNVPDDRILVRAANLGQELLVDLLSDAPNASIRRVVGHTSCTRLPRPRWAGPSSRCRSSTRTT
jgi:hypothetical protein